MSDNTMIMFFEIESLTQSVDKDSQTLLWATNRGLSHLRTLDYLADAEGYCYLRAITFFCDFARLQESQFLELLTRLKEELGSYPTANEVLVELVWSYFDTFGNKAWAGNERAVYLVRKRVKESRIKIKFTDSDSDITHLEKLGCSPFCECESPVCIHGYGFDMASALSLKRSRRWGASGFDMGVFLSEAMGNPEEDFEDLYSQLEPAEEEVKKAKETVEKWDGAHLPSPQASPPSGKMRAMEDRLKAMEAELTYVKSKKPAPLSVASKTELTPQDSSSIISRYGRHFMDQGTVLSPSAMNSAADRQEGRTVFTVQDDLVSGFRMDENLVRAEQASIRKLTPINGLPRPFTCKRLNFLANLHTGIQRAIERRPESLQVAMFRAMRRRPELPCDELLYQVLICTIDRSTNTYSSNAFSLPYIEVGMHITEDSIAKTFDLLESEYKTKWFQEMKNISVPNFHDRYKKFSKDAMQTESPGRKIRSHSEQASEKTKKQRKGSSLLGFRN